MEKRRKNPVTSYSLGIVEEGLGVGIVDTTVSDDDIKKSKPFTAATLMFGLFIIAAMLWLLHIYASQSNFQQNRNIERIDIPSVLVDHEPLTKKLVDKLLDAEPHLVPVDTKAAETNIPDASTRPYQDLEKQVDDILSEIRSMKRDGTVIEEDEHAKELVNQVQEKLRHLIPMKYGPSPYYVEMSLTFPEVMLDSGPTADVIVVEMAPIELVPYSVYFFLELVSQWKGGAFHRNAGHVLQAMVYKSGKMKGLAFQEYHPEYPHKALTLGYAGRPGGPPFYISTVDNTANHGPGSQGSKTEADSCFGRVYRGQEVVERMKKQPGRGQSGFINDEKNYINIPFLKIINDVSQI